MHRLNAFSVKNVLTFQDTTIELGTEHGLYVIQGQNKDSRLANNTNAVGKSRLFAAIPTVLYETDPLSLKKRNKKDILKSKTSCMSLDITSHGKERFLFQQMPSNYLVHKYENSKFVNINEAGKAVKLEIARNYISKAFPISESLFYSTCYISDQRNCNFLNATSRDRLAFITDIFGLDVYDQLRKYFTKKLGEVAKAEIEYQTLAKELLAAQTRLSELNWSDVKSSKLKKYKTEQENLRNDLTKRYSRLGELKLARTKSEKLEQLLEHKKTFSKEIKILTTKQAELELKNSSSQLKIAEIYANYLEDLTEYKQRKKKLNQELDDLEKLDLTEEQLEKKHDVLTSEIESLYKIQERYLALKENYDEKIAEYEKYVRQSKKLLSALLSTPTAKKFKLTENSIDDVLPLIQESYDMARTTVSIARKLSDHDHKGMCAVCGSSTTTKDVKARLKSAEALIEDLQPLKEYLALDEVKKPKKVEGKDQTDLLKSKRQKLKSITNDLQLSRKIKSINDRIKDLKKPKEPKHKPNKSLKELKDSVKNLESYVSLMTRIKDIGTVSYDKKLYKETQNRISLLENRVNELETFIRKLDLSRIEHSNYSQIVKDLSFKVAEVEPLLREREKLKTLQTAYSPNNLKLQAAEQIVSELEDSLNRYSSLVFLEPMKFQIRTVKDGISATVTRNNGESSDIIHLSGAEANCFRLLFFYSLVRLLPENKRTNFLILDEPDSRCSAAIRSHLIREFLPNLRKVVPHVFWITPKSVHDFQDHKLLTVIKEKGVSRLELT
jgi:DNA repair exonuclease SbcCD ATPase subunit